MKSKNEGCFNPKHNGTQKLQPTPTPWKADAQGTRIYNANGKLVCVSPSNNIFGVKKEIGEIVRAVNTRRDLVMFCARALQIIEMELPKEKAFAQQMRHMIDEAGEPDVRYYPKSEGK